MTAMQTEVFFTAQEIMAKISQDGSVEDMFDQLGVSDAHMDNMAHKEIKVDWGDSHAQVADTKPRQMLLMALVLWSIMEG